jgi:hypothetical protein
MISGKINILEPGPIDKLIVDLSGIVVLADLTAIGISPNAPSLIYKCPGTGSDIQDSETGFNPIVLAAAGGQLQIMLIILGLVVPAHWGILGPVVFLVAILVDKGHFKLANDSTIKTFSQSSFFVIDLGGDPSWADLEGFFLHLLKLGTAAYAIDIPHG